MAGNAIDKHVVDTNVLLVASAGDEGSPFPADATPVEKAELRLKVLEWLEKLEKSPKRKVVLDLDRLILDEYENKLSYQDYGLLMILHKRDYGQTVDVLFEVDNDGHAILPPTLQSKVHDAADRKMVAAALEVGGREAGCRIVNACDTDWYDWEQSLLDAGIEVQQLLDEWCRNLWKDKKDRQDKQGQHRRHNR